MNQMQKPKFIRRNSSRILRISVIPDKPGVSHGLIGNPEKNQYWIPASRLGEALRRSLVAGMTMGDSRFLLSAVFAPSSTARLLRSTDSDNNAGQASPKASPACNATCPQRYTQCCGRVRSIAGRHCGGQAMIEFTIALVAIIVVIIGTILLNRMTGAHTRTMTTARATAGALALDLIYQGPLDAKFISDWEAGDDNVRYTHDDEPDLDGTAISLVGDMVANAGLDEVSPLPVNAISRTQTSPTPLNEFYLVKGHESMAVDLSTIPAIRHLISGEPTISVESESWLVWTGGIY